MSSIIENPRMMSTSKPWHLQGKEVSKDTMTSSAQLPDIGYRILTRLSDSKIPVCQPITSYKNGLERVNFL